MMAKNLDASIDYAGVKLQTQAETEPGKRLRLSEKSRRKLLKSVQDKSAIPDRDVVTKFLDGYYAGAGREQACPKCDQRMTIRFLHAEGGWIAPRPVNAGDIKTDNMVAFVACACGDYGFIFRADS